MSMDIRLPVPLFPLVVFLVLSVVVSWQSVDAEGKIIVVDDDGGEDFRTIREAVENATGGDRVEVKAGIYHGTIYVNVSIDLVGAGGGTTIIDGNGTTYAMFVSGNGVNIRGFSFINSKRGIGVTSADVWIFNTSFTVNNTYGIEMQNADGVHIENNQFRNCKASGIGITDSRDITILNCEFSNNGYGVSYLRSTKSIVEECEFRNHSMGIYLHDSRDVRIRHNSFSNSTRAGISIFGDHHDIDIRDNIFDEFRYEVRFYGRDDEGPWGNTFVVASVVIIAGMVMVAAVIFITFINSQ